MTELVLPLIVGVAPVLGVLVARVVSAARWSRSAIAYELRFPRGIARQELDHFIKAVSGLRAPIWQRAWAARAVVLETVSTEAGIKHYFIAPRDLADLLLPQLQAAVPGLRTDPCEPPDLRADIAGELVQSTPFEPLNEDGESVSKSLLTALQPLTTGESLAVQILLAPAAVRSETFSRHFQRLLGGKQALETRQSRKSYFSLLAAVRIGVSAPSVRRRRHLLRRLTAAFHLANGPKAHLRRSVVPSSLTTIRMTRRVLPLVRYPLALTAAEVSGLLAFPLGSTILPGLSPSAARQLPPISNIPHGPRVLGRSNYPGTDRPLALSVTDSLRHLHVLGPTGVGKSTLLLNLITQDMNAGRGVVIVDPKGDLVAEALDRVPPRRVRDVIIVDPNDEERPVGLNLLARSGDAPELVVDQVVAMFHNLFKEFWGPRTDDILRSALLTLVQTPGMTLAEIPPLLTEASFRRRLVSHLDDPTLVGFWAWFDALSEAERANAIGPVMNKLRSFLLRRRVRHVIGQSEGVDLASAVSERRIIMVPLAKGLLGSEAAALLGTLVVSQLWAAIQARAAQRADDRPPTFLFADEFQDFVAIPTDFGDLLAQARGLGLGTVLAHQHLSQLPHGLRQAVMANVRSRVVFQLGATDARIMARELTPFLGHEDLQSLGAHEVVLHLAVGARVAPPATATTSPPPQERGTAHLARAASRKRYGRDRHEVESAIRDRVQAISPNDALGTRRRRGGAA